LQLCVRCQKSLPPDAFTPSSRGRRGTWCRSCHKAYAAAWHAARRAERMDVTAECSFATCANRIDMAQKYCGRHLRATLPSKPKVWPSSRLHVSYNSMHLRLQRALGPASAHPCVGGCGALADQWAYGHADPYEVTETRRRDQRLIAYSLNPRHYQPLCRSCHVRVDQKPAPIPPAPSDRPSQLDGANRLGDILGPRPDSDVDLRKPAQWFGQRKHCTQCRMVKDFGAFSPDRHRPTGRANRCRRCDAKRYRKRRADQGHIVRPHLVSRVVGRTTAETLRSTRARHRDRAVQVYGGDCVWCGSTDDLQFDHINNDGKAHRAVESGQVWERRISRSGRPDDQWEIQLLCQPCHSGPGWRQRRASATPAAGRRSA
jgi:hypothetical protein